MRIFAVWFFTSLLFSVGTLRYAHAGELVESFTSVRALGMGNAYTAVVKDKDSLFYNPAGLAKVQGFNFTLLGLKVGADGSDIVQTVQEGQKSDKYADTLRKLYGKNIWVGFGGLSAITIPGFGVAAYDHGEVAANLTNPAFPNLNFRYINDYGFSGGIAIDVLPTVHIGVVGSRITRSGGSFPIGVSTLATLSDEDLKSQINNSGTGYAGTLGLIMGIPTPANPRVSFVYKNAGVTSFTRDAGTRAPPPIDSELIAGFAFNVPLPLIDITTSVDYKYINQTDEQIGKKIHFGMEIALPIFAVRGGFNQGYYTAGAGIDLPFVKVDAATYGVELGEYPGQKEDRRYILSATIEFNFDPSFSFLGRGGSGSGRGGTPSGIKQRR